MGSYDQIAAWYDESVRTGTLFHDLVVPSLFDLVGVIAGQRICDLACGQGVVARQLAQRGATVVGIDVSTKLLDIARREEEAEPLGILYLHEDAQSLSSLSAASFDGVLCNLALMDIVDIEAVFQAVQRVLRPGGWFAFSITHPCFQTSASTWMNEEGGMVSRVVQGYFREGFWRSNNPGGVRGRVGSYHRMLSTYLNTLIAAGFSLERITEPPASGRLAERVPGYQEVPIVLLILCR
ncbi:MAG TPA: methyltransferase domain-containing protein, partial [Ktedonosporobacter sp.]|nr:methyltransferase domain-containing protein [Ktedonosporobacter sp.]